MFICERCKATSNAGEQQHKIVVEKREKEYNNHGVISKGWEIVKELKVCTICK